ncbi:MAG: hypothetical protein J6C46_11500 [Clostridia bacterium]|nr:hypothetical protein [Clostridia bacterium]
MNIDNNKPKAELKLTLTFYEEEPKTNTFGSNNVVYEIYYFYDTGIIHVEEVEAFGDRTLVARFQDRRGRGITEDEMLENIKEFTSMTYKEFREKILNK